MDWKDNLGLELHPEGGYFKRIYTSQRCHQTMHGERALVTSIYYLLDSEQPLGRLHRNRSDILHFFLDGGPVNYVLLGADGVLKRERMDAERRFLAVPCNCWKASSLAEGSTHALVAEVVAPGFDYQDRTRVRHRSGAGPRASPALAGAGAVPYAPSPAGRLGREGLIRPGLPSG